MKSNLLLRWLLITLLAASGSAISFLACSPPVPKKLGEACQTNGDCDNNLICTQNKCSEARLPTDTRKPIANAGPDRSLKVGEKVDLTAGESVSVEGKTLKFKWSLKTKPDGSTAALSAEDAKDVSFTPDKVGLYVLSLVVNDGKDSDPDEVSVQALSANRPPVAVVGDIIRVELGSKVEVDGSKSTDPDNNTLTYKWEIFKAPDASKSSLTDDAKAKTDFTPDKVGTYALRLTVRDAEASSSANLFVEVVINNPKPEITALTPSQGAAKINVPVQIQGKNFLFGIKLLVDGKEASYEYKGPELLKTSLDLTASGPGIKIKFKVVNPDRKESNEKDFDVVDTQDPTITKLSPELLITGQSILFVVEGTNFLPGAKVNFNKADVTATVESATKLTASAIAPAPGQYDLFVTNPDSKKTASVKVTVSGVMAILDDLSLDKVGSDCKKETMTVKGKNFLPGAKILFVDQNDPTKTFTPDKADLKSTSEILIEQDFTKLPPGSYGVQVTNPDTPTGPVLRFRVTPPPGPPKILGVYPPKVLLGDNVPVFVVGLDLDKSGKLVSTTIQGSVKKVINTATYQIEIDFSKITQAGKYTFELTASCGRKSDPIEIEVANEVKPTITGPQSLFSGAAIPKVTLTGSNFGLAPAVTVNAAAVTPVTRIDAYTLEIPGTSFSAAGDYKVIVDNKGGLKSDEFTIKVIAPDPTMVVDLVDDASSLFYVGTKNLRSDETPTGTPAFLFYDLAGTQMCTKDGIATTDSASYSDRIYASNPLPCDGDMPALVAGNKYKVHVKKTDGTATYISAGFEFTLRLASTIGGSTPTPGPTLKKPPVLRYLNPGSIVANPNTTAQFDIYSQNLVTGKVPNVYLNGTKLDATVDTNFTATLSGTSYVRVVITKPADGTVHRVELENDDGRSNAIQLHVDAVGKARLKEMGTTSYPMVYNTDDFTTSLLPDFDIYGDFIKQTGQKYFVNGTGYTIAGSSPYYIYTTGPTDAEIKAFSGLIKVYVSDAADVKISNEVSYQFTSNATGGWGKYLLPLELQYLSENVAAYPGDKVKIRLANIGFEKEDGQMKKGEVLFDGQTLTNLTTTNPTSTALGYADTEEIEIKGDPRVAAVEMKNPDGTASNKLYFMIHDLNAPLIRNYTVGASPNYNFASNVLPDGGRAVTLRGSGFNATSTYYFAGRRVSGTATGGSAVVNIDTRGLSVGSYPLWFESEGKGSNTIWIRVADGKVPAVNVPKFNGFGPFYLDSRLLTTNGMYRFKIIGKDLNEDLSFVVGTKKGKLINSNSLGYFLADIDLTGVAKGTYDVYLENTNAKYTSPKLVLEIF